MNMQEYAENPDHLWQEEQPEPVKCKTCNELNDEDLLTIAGECDTCHNDK